MDVGDQNQVSSALPRERDTVFILQEAGVGLGDSLDGWGKLRPHRGSNNEPPIP